MKGVSTAKTFKCQAYVQKFLIFFRRDLWMKVEFRRTPAFLLCSGTSHHPQPRRAKPAVPGLPPHVGHLSCICCTATRRFPAILPKTSIPAPPAASHSHHSSRIYRNRSNTPRPPAPPAITTLHAFTAPAQVAPPRLPVTYRTFRTFRHLRRPASLCLAPHTPLAAASAPPAWHFAPPSQYFPACTSQPAPPPIHIASLPRPGV